MENTVALYRIDPLARECSAIVTGIVLKEERVLVTTDRTVCYPEGGGQPGDRGWLGSDKIVDTIFGEERDIFHILDGPATCQVGDTVVIRLDWEHRFDFMQQHTAQHLVSGLLYGQAGIGTVAVHFGKDLFSIETDVSDVELVVMRRVEDAVNAAVRSNVVISTQECSREEADALNLRRPVKVDGIVRLVSIGSWDTIACGGVHVPSVSDIQLVLYMGSERIRGRQRTLWIAGRRAVELVRNNQEVLNALVAELSAPPNDLVGMVHSLKGQLASAEYARKKCLISLASLSLSKHMALAPVFDGIPIVAWDVTGSEDPDMFRSLVQGAEDVENLALAVVQNTAEGSLLWMVMLKGRAQAAMNTLQIKERLLPIIDGKGGGRPPLWQGIGRKSDTIHEFLDSFVSLVKEGLNNAQ